MTDDLIQRLRSQEAVDAKPHEIEQLTDEAADALEAANARIAELDDLENESDDYVEHYRAELEKANARITELSTKCRLYEASLDKLDAEADGLRAARIAYASEFPPDAEGLPDVGSIHANIRKLKAAVEHPDMVWPEHDGEQMFHTLDDAVEAAMDDNGHEVGTELIFTCAARLPKVTVRIIEVTATGFEWEEVTA
jgi:hypothetical protein